MEKVTNKEPVKQKPAVKIRCGEIKSAMESGSLSDDLRKWCEIVVANNPPGQLLHVDPSVVESLTAKPKVKHDENV